MLRFDLKNQNKVEFVNCCQCCIVGLTNSAYCDCL